MSDEQNAHVRERILEVEKALGEVILGKPALIRNFMTGVLARGHILLEGLPGLGKTLMVRAFTALSGLTHRRIQFTPDLMHLDITGSYILVEQEGKGREFRFQEGPIFGNLILADEINRASPKTQSALLEAMQERRVTVLSTTHDLPRPFMVMATQNPIELEGTYPLPEAQLDRFLFKLEVGDVPADVLERLVMERGRGDLPELSPLLDRETLLEAMRIVEGLPISRPVAAYAARLVRGTHEAPGVRYGASPRAVLAIAMAARALAFLSNRDTVGFEDVREVALPALRHRIVLDYQTRLEGVRADDIVEKLLDGVDALDRNPPSNVVGTLS